MAGTLARTLPRLRDPARDYGLLVLRIGAGLLVWIFHMRPKLAHFEDELLHFPDPLGVGHTASFALALAGEGVCSVLVMLGLLTRLACVPIVFTMSVVLSMSATGFEAADVQAALLYALLYTVIALLGPGRYALDARLGGFYERMLNRLP